MSFTSNPQRVLLLQHNEIVAMVDCTTSETMQADVEVTDHPVESGADITDHAREKPESLTLVGLFSNTPVNIARAHVMGVQDIKEVGGWAESMFALLRKLKKERQFLKVITPLRTYDNMLITSLSVPRDATTGHAVHFTLTLREIRLAKLLVVSRTVVKSKEPKAQPPNDTGKQVATPKNPESVAHSIGITGDGVVDFTNDPLKALGLKQ